MDNSSENHVSLTVCASFPPDYPFTQTALLSFTEATGGLKGDSSKLQDLGKMCQAVMDQHLGITTSLLFIPLSLLPRLFNDVPSV